MDSSQDTVNPNGLRHVRSPLRVWWREIVSLAVVLGIVAAIVGILVPYQDRPLPAWPRGITMNALVSLLIVIAKFLLAFVLAECLGQLKWTWFEKSRPLGDFVHFERASRGSLWGAVRLLWVLRGRSLLACVGAIVTVTSVAIDPFTQQLIQYYSCQQIATTQVPSLSVARTWFDSDQYLVNTLNVNSAGYGVQGAVMNGLFSPVAAPVPFRCGTGNCTFDEPIYTIGYSSKCKDVTPDIVFVDEATTVATLTHAFVTVDEATQTHAGLVVETEAVQFPGFRLPSGLTVQGGVTQTNFTPVSTNASRWTWEGNFEILFAGITGVNASIANDSNTLWSERGLGAVRCNIKPTIFGIKSSIRAGVLSEDITSTLRDIDWKPAGFAGSLLVVIHTTCLTDQQRTTLRSKVGPGELPEWFTYDQDPSNDTSIPENCIYSLDTSSTNGLTYFMSSYLTQSGFDGGHAAGGGAPPQVNVFYRHGNTSFSVIDSAMNNVSRSLSSYFRQISGANVTSGTVYEQTTCVNIEWKWFSFFASMVALTILVLLSTVVREWRTGHDFKTGILPLIFGARGMGGPEGASAPGHLSENSVQKRNVRWAFEGEGWRFMETGPEKINQETLLVKPK